MQRWFFLEDHKKDQKIKEDQRMSTAEQQEGNEVLFQRWTFSVSTADVKLRANDKVYITGNIPSLGMWYSNKCVPMEYHRDTQLWMKTVNIPNTCDIHYRYAICSVLDNNEIVVRLWETNILPRIIPETLRHPTTDVFGEYNNIKKVDRGWLTAQTLLQFKFLKNPLKLKSRKAERIMYIKVTPVKLSFGTDGAEDSLSNDNVESYILPEGVQVEVSTLDDDPALCHLQPQQQFGREYRPDDVLLINVYAHHHYNLAYLIDFYAYSSRAASESPPYHVGYTYVLPNMFKASEGSIELPVTCNVKHRPLGTINIEYLIVLPMPSKLCDFQASYSKHWSPGWTGLEVGHRGLGASFKTKGGNPIRENTVASLKQAAASGADMLEFDVQLSKDMVPVIYHDYYVCISMKRKKEVDYSEMLELPVKDLTLEHLQKLKVYHLVEGHNQEMIIDDEDLEEHQPFPTLEEMLDSIEQHVGFNVELKWNMELEDGTFELSNPFDMNVYVDRVLDVVLMYAGNRRIIFSCFNPDICTMVRNKQNKYPVMFLTQGETKKYKPYSDPRCRDIPAAVRCAVSSEILGIVVHTEDLLRDPSQVKFATDAGLIIFCWGDDNNDSNTIKKLKEMGLHAVIYDKLNQYTTKEVKESIFLVEARESERELIQLAVEEGGAGGVGGAASSASQVSAGEQPPRPYLDLTVRNRLRDHSTVTSLESLASAFDDLRSPLDKNLKRQSEISIVEKESQVKEQRNYLCGFLPAGDTTPKKSRND